MIIFTNIVNYNCTASRSLASCRQWRPVGCAGGVLSGYGVLVEGGGLGGRGGCMGAGRGEACLYSSMQRIVQLLPLLGAAYCTGGHCGIRKTTSHAQCGQSGASSGDHFWCRDGLAPCASPGVPRFNRYNQPDLHALRAGILYTVRDCLFSTGLPCPLPRTEIETHLPPIESLKRSAPPTIQLGGHLFGPSGHLL